MEIKNITNTNFQGTFKIKSASEQVKKEIPDIIKRGREIFYDVKEKGDVFLVTHIEYDRKVRDFIAAKKLKFRYYPEITPNSMSEVPPTSSELKKLITKRHNCATSSLKVLNTYVNENLYHLSKQSKYFANTLNTLGLCIKKPKVKLNKDGIFSIRDTAKQQTIKSTGFQKGISFDKPFELWITDFRKPIVKQPYQFIS